MSSFARDSELEKLARVLGAPLDLPLDVAGLRAVREACSAQLFDDAKPMLQRVATGSRLLPAALVARVGERVFGAPLCAQIASLLAPAYALDLALRMSDAFLASVSAAIDPRGAGAVVAAIPAPRIVAVAHVLLARRDYLTLARFVDYLSAETIGAVIDSIPDELELLRIAAHVESGAKLSELVGQLSEARTRAMLAALPGADLWREVQAVAELVDEPRLRRLAAIAASIAPEFAARFPL